MDLYTGEVRKEVTVQDLLQAGLHFGHQTKRWNPKMKRYIFDARGGIYIIDLNKSLAAIQEAKQFVYDTSSRGRKILFVGTKKQAQIPLKEIAEKLKQPYIVNRWLGGTLTNNTTIRRSVSKMEELEERIKDESLQRNKKELSQIRRELNKLHYNLDGIRDMDQLPGAMFVVDVNREAIAVAEANRLNIPVIAMLDTNCNPDPIDYPIPANDDAIRAIKLVAEVLGEGIQDGSSHYEKVAAEEARRRAAAEAEAAAKAKAADEARKAKEMAARKARAEAVEKAKAEAAAKAAEQQKAKKEETAAAPEATQQEAPAAAPEKAPKTTSENAAAATE